MIRGLGRQKIAMYMTLIAAYPVQLPIAIWLTFRLKMGIAGLWWGDICGMITQMTLFFFLIGLSDWEKITTEAVARIEEERKRLAQRETKGQDEKGENTYTSTIELTDCSRAI